MHLGDLMLVLCNQSTEEMEHCKRLTGFPFHVDRVLLEIMSRPGEKWTLVDDDAPDKALVVGGLIPQRHGVFVTWCYVHRDAWETHPGQVTAQCRGVIERALKSGAHRVETVSLEGRPHVDRWYKKIGLNRETVLGQFGADRSNGVVYAAFKGAG
jgi:hypothetical protein